MSTADVLGWVLLAAILIYSLLGGADFGGGVLSALAFGQNKNEQRLLIRQAIGPVWEANHVWLILIVVLLFTCFPPAFAALSISLFIPILIFLVSVVLRGAAFAFYTSDYASPTIQKYWQLVFALASIIAPLMLGIIIGTVSSGRLRFVNGTFTGSYWQPWLGLFPIITGLHTVALFAYIAAVYLIIEAQSLDEQKHLIVVFRRVALLCSIAVFVLALFAIILAWAEAPIFFIQLVTQAWSIPLLLGILAAAIFAFSALLRNKFYLARLAAVLQIALLVISWGAAQAPYLIMPDITLTAASYTTVTQTMVLWALGLGSIILVPSIYLLMRIFKNIKII
ncbi:MAG: cytochrome d ubiquinol oxidase subunit II [Deltaproteobacteria bacterium]|nr:cytochrome d ubiquinol oxidase subunit II [Deltaproteobacteria bacterium]